VLRPEYVAAAVFEDDAADVDVNELHQGYLRRFKSAGGTLFLTADVQTLALRDSKWTAQTPVGDFAAPILVNAAGAWADTVAGKAGATPLKIKPRRRTALLAEFPAGISADAWPMVIDIDESFYLKPDAGLLLISPADETPVPPCDVQPEEFDVAVAVDRVEQATTLNITRIRRRWAGLRSFAPDRSPVIGFDGVLPGFFWLAGQGGYGIQTAPAAARLAASLLRGDAKAEFDAALIAQLSPTRFGSRPAARSHA
jgi:D-arginine dehydrogenase